jgi:hypothetical protein
MAFTINNKTGSVIGPFNGQTIAANGTLVVADPDTAWAVDVDLISDITSQIATITIGSIEYSNTAAILILSKKLQNTASSTPSTSIPSHTTAVGGSDGTFLRTMKTDSNGSPEIVGNITSLSADSGNPIKVGGVYNSTLPTVTTGERVDSQHDRFGRLIVVNVNKYKNLHGAATTIVKSGAGYLHTICCNNATASSVVTLYDNTSASGTPIAIITMGTGTSAQAFTQIFDIVFNTGLTIVTTVSGTDVTVSYQ